MLFPRDMPGAGVSTQRFELDRADYLSREGGGRLGAMSGGFPVWRAEWTLGGAATRAMSDDWRAFVTSLEGPTRLFFGRDVERPYPQAYPDGFAALSWNGDAASWSQSITADGQAELTLAGIPVGLVMGPGDYIGFRWATGGVQRRALVRNLAAEIGGSVSITLDIAPAVPAVVPETAVAYLANPTCLMRLDPRATEITSMDRRKIAGVRVVAVQDLLP